MITVKHISKSFADVQILKDVSFVFETGKTNLIIGKSGSGKSVLTKCIVGLFEPDEGEIFYDERKLSDLKPKARKEIRKEIGMLFQASALFDSITVEENVAFPLNMNTKMTKEEMQKRVAIARAIAMQPKYLFCDEPNSGLDPVTAIVIDELIKEITDEYNMTTIVITHDMNSVLEIGENIMFIDSGENKWTGTKNEILDVKVKELHDFIYVSKFLQQMKRKR